MEGRKVMVNKKSNQGKVVVNEQQVEDSLTLNWQDFGGNTKAILETGDSVICRRFSPTMSEPVLLSRSLEVMKLSDGLFPELICQKICEKYVREHEGDFSNFPDPIDPNSIWMSSPVPVDMFERMADDEGYCISSLYVEKEVMTRIKFDYMVEEFLNFPAEAKYIQELVDRNLHPMPDILTNVQAEMLLKAASLLEDNHDWPYGTVHTA